MHIEVRGVNEAFYAIVRGIVTGDVPTCKAASRNGPVLVVDEPVILTYEKPMERVLFNRARDCNLFFHVYEALWMLAGRNDVAPLAYYNKRMAEFSDDGGTLNGAYGYRWRRSPGKDEGYGAGTVHTYHDQLNIIVDHLRANPGSRRAVLSMWNVEDDLLKVGSYPCCEAVRRLERVPGDATTLTGGICPEHGRTSVASRDVACNLSAVFQVREGGPCKECKRRNQHLCFTDPGPCPLCGGPHMQVGWAPGYLDMTVFNRSNDLIWGMLGANAVHFSFLLEYVAARLGLAVGKYHQVTANLHAYGWNWHPDEWLKEGPYDSGDYGASPYRKGRMLLWHLVEDPERFDRENASFVEFNGQLRTEQEIEGKAYAWDEPFLALVAQPLCNAWHAYKRGDIHLALRWADLVEADDWRLAAVQWLTARKERRERGVAK
jgi:thymidylate synthase